MNQVTLQDCKCQICHDEIFTMDDATYFEDMGLVHIGCYLTDYTMARESSGIDDDYDEDWPMR